VASSASRNVNSRDHATPPRLAERLLAAAIRDCEWRDSIVGDLREEFAGLRQQIGDVRARRWYWRQACAIGSRAVLPRRAGSRRSRAWIPDADSAGHWSTGLGRELRSARRAVARQPGTSAVIVATLALALATNSVSFAVLDALVLRPFRFPDVDRVVMVVSSDPQQGLLDRESVTPGDFADWRREANTVKHLAAAQWWDANLSGIDQPEQIPGHKVTADFFRALGATPQLGREFVVEEETPGQHRRVVIGHALWTRVFGAEPSVLGRMVRVDGEAHEVVGVAPPGFAIPEGAQIWAPLAKTSEEWTDRRNRWLVTVGRLQEGATLADARAEIGAIAERQRREHPETNANRPNAVVSFTDGMQDAGAAGFLTIMLGASALLLLIACANIANLLLARGSERTQEFALRLALGGSRTRLAAQLMIEAGLLSTVAVLFALPLAAIGLAISQQSIPPSIVRFVPGWQYLEVSPTLFAVTAAFGVVATILFALVPAVQTVRPDVADTLRQGARTITAPRRRHWLRNSLATAQVALTLALLYGSVLMLSAVDRAVNGAMGFDRQNLLVARVVLPEGPYGEAERRRQFAAGVLDRLRAIPAVSDAAMISNIPYGAGNTSRQFYPGSDALSASEALLVDYRRATPGYFETLRIPLLAGRRLDDSDREGTQAVAVVSQALVDRYWPEQSPLGRSFRLAADGPPITVVGVVGDVLHDWFQRRRSPTVYRPLAQDAPLAQTFVARTVGDPISVAGDLRRAVGAVDADQPILQLQTMDTVIADRTAGLTYISGTITVVAGIALALALMGLYSLMAYIISRRTQELGVRLALGATRWQIVAVTTRAGLRVSCVGVILGAALAFATGRLMESALYGVVVMSVPELALVVAAVAVVSLTATYLPTRRAAGLDPVAALRAE
jgi:putative ABC transport system permease protein